MCFFGNITLYELAFVSFATSFLSIPLLQLLEDRNLATLALSPVPGTW
jgi:hypothetical protein